MILNTYVYGERQKQISNVHQWEQEESKAGYIIIIIIIIILLLS